MVAEGSVFSTRGTRAMVVRLSARGHAPLVAYADLADFDLLCHRTHDAYSELITAAVYARRQRSARSGALEAERAAMMLGAAEFCDMRAGGLQILLRLTKGKGARFCAILNEDIVNAVTTSSRTYVNSIKRLCLLNTDITFRVNMEDMIVGMRDAVVQWCGHCNTHAGRIGADLFDANFVAWGAPETLQQTFCPLSRLPDYLTAFAMTGHEHLHRRPGVVLPDDVLRQICAYLW